MALLFAVLLLLASSTAALSSAQTDDGLEVTIADVDDSAFPIVQMVLSANHEGRPLPGLSVDQLTVVEGGAPAIVRSVERATDAGTPLALVVAIDTSGSMDGPTLAAAQAAARSLVESLAPGDAAAILAFSTESRVVHPLSNDREALLQAIDSLSAGGDTALYDAVGAAATVARDAGIARRAVVLISDGEDFGGLSEASRETTLGQAADGGVLFYTIGVGAGVDREYLDTLATGSGGRSFYVDAAAELPPIYAAIEELLRSHFIVTVSSEGASAPGETRDIEVTLTLDGTAARNARSYESARPAPAAPSPTPVPTAEPAAPPVTTEVEPAPASSGPSAPLVGAAGVAILGGILGLLLVLRQRRMPAFVPFVARANGDPLPRPAAAANDRGQGGGVLTLAAAEGPLSFAVSSRPLRIGTGDGCEIRLPGGTGVADEHARVWLRDGRAMLHHVAATAQTLVNGASVGWASLHDGDAITVGAAELRYHEPALE